MAILALAAKRKNSNSAKAVPATLEPGCQERMKQNASYQPSDCALAHANRLADCAVPPQARVSYRTRTREARVWALLSDHNLADRGKAHLWRQISNELTGSVAGLFSIVLTPSALLACLGFPAVPSPWMLPRRKRKE